MTLRRLAPWELCEKVNTRMPRERETVPDGEHTRGKKPFASPIWERDCLLKFSTLPEGRHLSWQPPPLLTSTPKGRLLSLDRFNVHQLPLHGRSSTAQDSSS
ncbi:hypothetical protein TNCV_2129861 [Trichonephila clavipes]|nr:hypothetical protein TNCV_2129861 [Trichonephila clavipes]